MTITRMNTPSHLCWQNTTQPQNTGLCYLKPTSEVKVLFCQLPGVLLEMSLSYLKWEVGKISQAESMALPPCAAFFLGKSPHPAPDHRGVATMNNNLRQFWQIIQHQTCHWSQWGLVPFGGRYLTTLLCLYPFLHPLHPFQGCWFQGSSSVNTQHADLLFFAENPSYGI